MTEQITVRDERGHTAVWDVVSGGVADLSERFDAEITRRKEIERLLFSTVGAGGWGTTTLVDAAQGDTEIVVRSTAGARIGMPLTIGDPGSTPEENAVSSLSHPTVVRLASPLEADWPAGSPVFVVPAAYRRLRSDVDNAFSQVHDMRTYMQPSGDAGMALSEAYANVPSGGVIFLGEGSFDQETPVVIDRVKAVSIRGAGMGVPGGFAYGTRLNWVGSLGLPMIQIDTSANEVEEILFATSVSGAETAVHVRKGAHNKVRRVMVDGANANRPFESAIRIGHDSGSGDILSPVSTHLSELYIRQNRVNLKVDAAGAHLILDGDSHLVFGIDHDLILGTPGRGIVQSFHSIGTCYDGRSGGGDLVVVNRCQRGSFIEGYFETFPGAYGIVFPDDPLGVAWTMLVSANFVSSHGASAFVKANFDYLHLGVYDNFFSGFANGSSVVENVKSRLISIRRNDMMGASLMKSISSTTPGVVFTSENFNSGGLEPEFDYNLDYNRPTAASTPLAAPLTIAAGASTTAIHIGLSGAQPGDDIRAWPSDASVAGLVWSAYAYTGGSVHVSIYNPTASPVTLPVGFFFTAQKTRR